MSARRRRFRTAGSSLRQLATPDRLGPVGRMATLPGDMADVVAFLLGPDSRYVTGHDLVVGGA